ncbi:MAG: hypothetical protein SA339_05375 [Methanomassiliicoccus sp.]|nr:hypothetical protein [Methanomassiliicoccus sp.]
MIAEIREERAIVFNIKASPKQAERLNQFYFILELTKSDFIMRLRGRVGQGWAGGEYEESSQAAAGEISLMSREVKPLSCFFIRNIVG